jgi:hypothetical protein
MKLRVMIVLYLLPVCLVAQKKDSLFIQRDSSKTNASKAEILSGGFIDISQNGEMNASARLFRIYVGEPGKWQLPLSLYSGVSANNFSMSNDYEDLSLQLINPGAGILNISFDGNNRLIGTKRRLTSLRVQYQTGFRFLSVYNYNVFRNITFHNLVAGLGFLLATGAWEKDKPGNIGIFWLSLRALYSGNPATALKEFIEEEIKPEMLGYSIGLGVDISQALNIRAFYFRYMSNQHIAMFLKPALQLSFNYTVKE